MKSVDIMFLQEHWLHDNDLHTLNNISDDYLYAGSSGMGECTEILQGRRFGGIAFLWTKSLIKHVKPLKCTSIHFSAVKILLPNCKSVLLINVYLPVDNYKQDDVDQMFMSCINELDDFIAISNCDRLIVGGDMIARCCRYVAQ